MGLVWFLQSRNGIVKRREDIMEIDVAKLKDAIELIQGISPSQLQSIKELAVKKKTKLSAKSLKKVEASQKPDDILDFAEMAYDPKRPRSLPDRSTPVWRQSCAFWLKKFVEWGEPLEIMFSREDSPREYTGFPVDIKVESADIACLAYKDPKVKTLFYTYMYGLQLPSSKSFRTRAKQRMARIYNVSLEEDTSFKKFVSSFGVKDKSRDSSTHEIGFNFERQLEWAFFNEGFHVEPHGLRKKYDDEGVDLILVKNGHTHLVQAKAFNKGKKITPMEADVIFNQLKAFYAKHRHESIIVGDLSRCILVVANGESLPEETREHCIKIGLVFKIRSYEDKWPSVKCIIGSKGEKKYYTIDDQHWLGCNMLTDKRRFWATLEEAQARGYKPSKSQKKN